MKLRILLPTDFSKNSWHAITYALELYKSNSCEFYLLNVFSATGNIMKSLMNMEPGSELYEMAKAQSETGLANMLDMLVLNREKYPNHNFNTISMFNSTVEAIKIVVDDKDIDLIVMGTKGETASRTMVYGSTAVNVMEKVRNCPVLVVPEKAKPAMPKEIVFPTNYKLPVKKKELQYLIDIAKKTHATIQVLYINEGELSHSQLENKALLQEHFAEVNFVFRQLSNMHVPTAINCFVESRESDMVAFINKKHLFFGSILSQALVKEIGYDCKVPILVMHNLKN
ncbi:universal stress protein [Winogradskyella sp. DF17]|jgi:nucleotide-binding universal stress UspA family protein|uniref:Universal stress protein n=1 Tax=Winogradskyella pelagia TaxID=2819984 RepID=A0ABS3SZQ1_9FLAO|nr:universal stress protein [Winogradskyella sp. DF17]MBO3115970.1 universal stress protein [Winogradskyella sp. DF17]